MSKQTIVVVGCLPAQAQRVERECNGIAAQVLWRAKATTGRYRMATKSLFGSKFVGHRYGEGSPQEVAAKSDPATSFG